MHFFSFSTFQRLSVSILVLVDLALELNFYSRNKISYKSFNPCFSGSCSRIRFCQSSSRNYLCFNPCFSGSCSRIKMKSTSRHKSLDSEVSILVLVDLALEYISATRWRFFYWFQSLFQWILLSNSGWDVLADDWEISFNPCFSGSCSRIQKFSRKLMDLVCFNPCFSGSCSRIRRSCPRRAHTVRFQSLFQWILLSNLATSVNILGDNEVSILVLVDLALESFLNLVSFYPRFVSILVLVDLALELRGLQMLDIGKGCFNPCFSGSCSRIFQAGRTPEDFQEVSILVLVDLALEYLDSYFHLKALSLFQSLFQWILLSNDDDSAYLKFIEEFQSLFQWILLSNLYRRTHSSIIVCFNPCFSGSCSRIAGWKL